LEQDIAGLLNFRCARGTEHVDGTHVPAGVMSGAAVIFVRHPEVAGNRIDADVIRRIEVAQAAAETADRLKEIAVAVEFFRRGR